MNMEATPKRNMAHSVNSSTLADVLERILDKGLVIAGDIKIKLVDIELLTIQIRLLVCSVDKAREMGIDWWTTNTYLSSNATRRWSIPLTRALRSLRPMRRRRQSSPQALRSDARRLAAVSGRCQIGQRARDCPESIMRQAPTISRISSESSFLPCVQRAGRQAATGDAPPSGAQRRFASCAGSPAIGSTGRSALAGDPA